MEQFNLAQDSHAHSRKILDLLYEYDSFMDSLEVIADMGCGAGLDSEWFATLYTRDDPPEPHNYLVYAVDQNISKIEDSTLQCSERLIPIQGNFEQERIIPRQVDLMWCHDSFQYVTDPLLTLKRWNATMNVDGMLIITLPQHQTYQYNRLKNRSFSGCYYNYNICNIMYMLAVNGFDCRDSYFDMKENDPWISLAVYKSPHKPMDPASTTWFDLADKNLVNDSVMNSLNKYGHVRQEELLFTWLDKDWRFAKN